MRMKPEKPAEPETPKPEPKPKTVRMSVYGYDFPFNVLKVGLLFCGVPLLISGAPMLFMNTLDDVAGFPGGPVSVQEAVADAAPFMTLGDDFWSEFEGSDCTVSCSLTLESKVVAKVHAQEGDSVTVKDVSLPGVKVDFNETGNAAVYVVLEGSNGGPVPVESFLEESAGIKVEE